MFSAIFFLNTKGSLFVFDGKWAEVEVENYDENGVYVFYKGSFLGSKIAIVGKEKNFLIRIKEIFI